MVKRLHGTRFFLSAFAVVLLFLVGTACMALADQDLGTATPLFDGQDGIEAPQLRLKHCNARLLDVALAPSSAQTDRVYNRLEFWTTDRPPSIPVPTGWIGRSVTVQLWRLNSVADARAWPKKPMAKVWRTTRFPGWNASDVGDVTCWSGDRTVVFAKGVTVVRLDVNSRLLGRDYTARIATALADKL